MIDCCDLVAALAARGWNHACGVPCSTFSGPIAHLSVEGRYRASANEGLALSDAAGAQLAGRQQVIMLQNSGLGNLINPLTSLCQPYQIPVLAMVSMRGWPDPGADEPQHSVMGRTTGQILSDLGIWHATLLANDLDETLDEASRIIAAGRPAFLLLPYRSIGHHPGTTPSTSSSGPDTADIAALLAKTCNRETVIFGTTGHASRYLHHAGDRSGNFYMQGSMGHVASLATGYATARPDERVVILDGDGASLMHLGALSTIGAEGPENLVHVIIDNGGYESTGAQKSTSPTTNLAEIGRACGYRTVGTVQTLPELEGQLSRAAVLPGPHLIVVEAGRTVRDAPERAGATLALPDMATRLRERTATRMRTAGHA